MSIVLKPIPFRLLVHQLLSSHSYFMFLVSFYCIKILSRSYGYDRKFCFVEENNIPKNTERNLEFNALVHQILSLCCYFCFLFPSTALKFLAVAMAMSKCQTIGLPNHRSAEPFKFCFAEENNIPKITGTNLALNALGFTV